MKLKTNSAAKNSEKGKNIRCLCNDAQPKQNILLELYNDLQNMVVRKPKESMRVICGHRCKCNCGCRNRCQAISPEKKKSCLRCRLQDKVKDSCKDQPDLAEVYLSTRARQVHIATSRRSSKICQKKLRNSFEDQLNKFGVNEIFCPNVLKLIVEDLYKDFEAMKSTLDYGLGGRREAARRGVSDSCIGILKKSHTSFPVSICSVRPVGSRALIISWVVHSFCGLVGYEVWVDDCCKTRLHTTSYNTTCTYDVDVTKNHIVVLYPIVTEECLEEVRTSGVRSSICQRDLRTPKGPLLPLSWTPSVYVYIPVRCKEDA